MNGPFDNAYWKYACTELETLQVMGDLNVVDHDYDMNVIISIWDFKVN